MDSGFHGLARSKYSGVMTGRKWSGVPRPVKVSSHALPNRLYRIVCRTRPGGIALEFRNTAYDPHNSRGSEMLCRPVIVEMCLAANPTILPGILGSSWPTHDPRPRGKP